MTSNAPIQNRPRIASGVPGLDTLLGGGLPGERIYLIQGGPGTGKTTLGFQFLLEGAKRGESVLYASLLQTRDELTDLASSHGWDIEGIHVIELPRDIQESITDEQTIFSPAEVELDEATDAIVEAINQYRPRRMVLDSLSELQVLVEHSYRMRLQLIKLKRALLDAACTAVVTAGDSLVDQMPTTQTIVHGAIYLTHETPRYGPARRALEIEKIRGIEFSSGRYDMDIHTGGIEVYPHLRPQVKAGHRTDRITSGNEALDAMFGGGLHCGSACLVMGTSGAGKSTLVSQYASAVARDGRSATVYCLDESRQTLLRRAEGLSMPISQQVEQGLIDLREYDVGDLTPGRLMRDLRRDVEQRQAGLVIIDSITGYRNLMPFDEKMTIKLHEILRYLASHDVLTLITANVHGLVGPIDVDVDTSYLADTVVLMRHFEAGGVLRNCLSVVKNRHGDHERTIREVAFSSGGLQVGPPITSFSGILTGAPTYSGQTQDLIRSEGESSGGQQVD